MNTTTDTVRVRLTGWGDFPDLGPSIRALLFGAMIKRAIPVVQEFHSDLHHDALWIAEYVNGPTSIDYLVRTSGTNISLTDAEPNSAVIGVQIGAPGGVFYRIALTEERGMWSADFTEIPLDTIRGA